MVQCFFVVSCKTFASKCKTGNKKNMDSFYFYKCLAFAFKTFVSKCKIIEIICDGRWGNDNLNFSAFAFTGKTFVGKW